MITIKRVTEIHNCTACGEANYPAEKQSTKLFSVTAGNWTTIYCKPCLEELQTLTQPINLATLEG